MRRMSDGDSSKPLATSERAPGGAQLDEPGNRGEPCVVVRPEIVALSAPHSFMFFNFFGGDRNSPLALTICAGPAFVPRTTGNGGDPVELRADSKHYDVLRIDSTGR